MNSECPVCFSLTRRKFQINQIWIRKCDCCTHQYAEFHSDKSHLSRVYDDRYFSGGKWGYPDYVKDQEYLIDRGRKYARFISSYLKPGAMLDVGCAAGFMMMGFREDGWNCTGVEANQSIANHGREKLGLNILSMDVRDLDSKVEFDLINFIQVIAHLEDPSQIMRRLSSSLRSGGYVFVETWNSRSMMAKLAGRRWHEYSPPHALHYFSRKSLQWLMGNYGFTRVFSKTIMKSISGAHARSVLRQIFQSQGKGDKTYFPISMIPDRIRIPYVSDDLFISLFKKGN